MAATKAFIFMRMETTGGKKTAVVVNVYVAGVVFFKCDGRIPLAHAIWHLFVLAGSMIHYFAVLEHLYGAGSQPQAVLVNVEMSGPKILHSEF